MVTTKTLADLLTTARFGLAWIILWLGMTHGAEALPTTMMILILAWLTDVLDGPLARRDPSGRRTWIGDHDLETDMSVALAVLAYLALSGYVAPKVALGYCLICAILLVRFRSVQLAWAVQALPYAGIVYTALRNAQLHGLVAVGYIALIVLATWPRAIKVTIPQFLQGMRNLKQDRTMDSGHIVLDEMNGNGQRLRPLGPDDGNR